MLQWVVLLVVVAAAVLVLVDSARLGARRGALGGGLLDIGPVGWFVCVLLVWFVALPAYLVARRRLVALGAAGSTAAQAPDAPAAAAPAPARERGRHRAEPASRTRRSAGTRAATVPTAVPTAVVAAAPTAVPTAVVAAPAADPVAAPAAAVDVEPEPLVPPFAEATSWAATADEPSFLHDHSVGAFAPGEPVPGPFAAQPWSTDSFVGDDQPAAQQDTGQDTGQDVEPVTGPTPVEPEPLVASPADSPYLSRFAELCAEGLMSQAELDRVRARLSGTPST